MLRGIWNPGGFFVIEVIVPPWQRLAPGETVIPFDVSPAHLGFDEIDVATQNSWSHHYWFGRLEVAPCDSGDPRFHCAPLTRHRSAESKHQQTVDAPDDE